MLQVRSQTIFVQCSNAWRANLNLGFCIEGLLSGKRLLIGIKQKATNPA
jgi:hypothetical protein